VAPLLLLLLRVGERPHGSRARPGEMSEQLRDAHVGGSGVNKRARRVYVGECLCGRRCRKRASMAFLMGVLDSIVTPVVVLNMMAMGSIAAIALGTAGARPARGLQTSVSKVQAADGNADAGTSLTSVAWPSELPLLTPPSEDCSGEATVLTIGHVVNAANITDPGARDRMYDVLAAALFAAVAKASELRCTDVTLHPATFVFAASPQSALEVVTLFQGVRLRVSLGIHDVHGGGVMRLYAQIEVVGQQSPADAKKPRAAIERLAVLSAAQLLSASTPYDPDETVVMPYEPEAAITVARVGPRIPVRQGKNVALEVIRSLASLSEMHAVMPIWSKGSAGGEGVGILFAPLSPSEQTELKMAVPVDETKPGRVADGSGSGSVASSRLGSVASSGPGSVASFDDIPTHVGPMGGPTILGPAGAPVDPPVDPPADPPVDPPADGHPIADPAVGDLRAAAAAAVAGLEDLRLAAALQATRAAAQRLEEKRAQENEKVEYTKRIAAELDAKRIQAGLKDKRIQEEFKAKLRQAELDANTLFDAITALRPIETALESVDTSNDRSTHEVTRMEDLRRQVQNDRVIVNDLKEAAYRILRAATQAAAESKRTYLTEYNRLSDAERTSNEGLAELRKQGVYDANHANDLNAIATGLKERLAEATRVAAEEATSKAKTIAEEASKAVEAERMAKEAAAKEAAALQAKEAALQEAAAKEAKEAAAKEAKEATRKAKTIADEASKASELAESNLAAAIANLTKSEYELIAEQKKQSDIHGSKHVYLTRKGGKSADTSNDRSADEKAETDRLKLQVIENTKLQEAAEKAAKAAKAAANAAKAAAAEVKLSHTVGGASSPPTKTLLDAAYARALARFKASLPVHMRDQALARLHVEEERSLVAFVNEGVGVGALGVKRATGEPGEALLRFDLSFETATADDDVRPLMLDVKGDVVNHPATPVGTLPPTPVGTLPPTPGGPHPLLDPITSEEATVILIGIIDGRDPGADVNTDILIQLAVCIATEATMDWHNPELENKPDDDIIDAAADYLSDLQPKEMVDLVITIIENNCPSPDGTTLDEVCLGQTLARILSNRDPAMVLTALKAEINSCEVTGQVVLEAYRASLPA
jgi:hypothetical protein